VKESPNRAANAELAVVDEAQHYHRRDRPPEKCVSLMPVVPNLLANSPDLDEQLFARLRRALRFLKYARKFATYEFAAMSLAGAGGSVLADRLCPSIGWIFLASVLLVLGLILLAGAVVRTVEQRARRKQRRRRGR
jgi:hypothetical protein